jgi:hypothetical protein
VPAREGGRPHEGAVPAVEREGVGEDAYALERGREREGVERMRADGRCRSAGMEAPNPNFSYI